MNNHPSKISWRERLNISRIAIKYSALTVFLWLIVGVAGIFAFSSLKYALFPDITFPVVLIRTNAPIESVWETETQLTQPIQQSLKSLQKVDIYASTYPGQSIVTTSFFAGAKPEPSLKKVKQALEEVKLPEEAKIEVIPFNLNESPVIRYALTSETQSIEQLSKIASEQIIPSLTKLPGVRGVNLLGDGLLTQTTTEQPPTLVRLNGEDILALEVIKKSDANSLEVVKKVQKQIDLIEPKLPEVKFIVAESQAEYIKSATQATIEALFGAIALAVIIIFPFLRNFRATIITAIAIPLSLLGTFIVMAIVGLNLETLTLLALALVVGIIIDDAIVEVENIARHLENGQTPKQAAISATREIGLTVSASTLTIVAVFLPVALMGGTLGQFFKPFGLTVSAAVLISLLVARTLSPVLAVYWLKVRPNHNSTHPRPSLPFSNYYRNLLRWSLNHRKTVIIIAIISFIAGIGLIPLIPQGFIPQIDRGEFNLVYSTALPKLPSGSKPQVTPEIETKTADLNWLQNIRKSPTRFLLRRTRNIGEKLEQVILSQDEVASAFNIIGVRGEPNKGKIYIKLKPERELSTSEVEEKLRAALPQLSGVTTSLEDIAFIETGDDTPLKIALLGNDLQTLADTATKLKNRLTELPELEDIKITGSDEQVPVIDSYNSSLAMYLSANLKEGQAIGNVTKKVVDMAQKIIPADVSIELQGDSARVGEIFGQFAITLILSIICMLGVLILLFGRILEPLVVILSLPLSIVGAMLALLITQSEFGMISLIGLIFLLGLLDKNAILLMDYTNQLRSLGKLREQAILEAGVVRLRPIVMTTSSTILGMLPIALGLGAGSELRQPMAVAIIGGLITSSLLSLIVVPVIYTLLEDFSVYLSKRGS